MKNQHNAQDGRAPYAYLWDSSAPFATTYSGLASMLRTELVYSVQSLISGTARLKRDLSMAKSRRVLSAKIAALEEHSNYLIGRALSSDHLK